MEIKKTKDYTIFKGIVGNRSFNANHLANLTKSILNKNLLAMNPIIVNKEMRVVDGQHRLEVAKNNKLDIYYLVVDEGDLSDVLTLNVNRQNWTSNDYLESYISLGNANYIYLKDFISKYGVATSMAIEMLAGNARWGVAWRMFKEGKFEATNKLEAEQFADALTEIKPYCEAKAWRDREFIRAMRITLEVEAVPILVSKLSQSGRITEPKVTVKDYLRSFEDALNWRKSKDIVRLY